MLPVLETLQSDSEDEEDEEEEDEEEEEFDSEAEDGEEGAMSSQSTGHRYPSRSKNSRSTRLTRNRAGVERKRTGKQHHGRLHPHTPAMQTLPARLNLLCGSFSESRAEVNGHSSRSSRSARRHQDDSDRASSPEQGGDGIMRRLLKRKTARAAVNKIKLLEASDEDYEEEKPRRSSSRLRHTARGSKRTAVIQSSSESDQEPSARGRK